MGWSISLLIEKAKEHQNLPNHRVAGYLEIQEPLKFVGTCSHIPEQMQHTEIIRQPTTHENTQPNWIPTKHLEKKLDSLPSSQGTDPKNPAFSQENDGASRWFEGRDMEIHWAGFYKDQPAGCSHQLVVYFSKGIHPKLAETFRLRIYV